MKKFDSMDLIEAIDEVTILVELLVEAIVPTERWLVSSLVEIYSYGEVVSLGIKMYVSLMAIYPYRDVVS